MAAMRGADDSQWREYVVATLGNPTIEDLARNGDAMDKLLAETQLLFMDSKADLEKAHQNQLPAQ